MNSPKVWPLNSRPGDIELAVPTDVLTSFHYFRDTDIGLMKSWGLRIIGDSGAFSAMSLGKPIDREEFHQWAHRWKDDLFWTAGLDVIGDPDGTFANWKAAKRDGLDLVPTIHYLGGTELIDRYVDEGQDFLGLGGMVAYSSEPQRLMRWCLKMHRHARDHHPHVRFHGWGISHPLLMDNLPWWSADSSGFSSAFRFGTMRLFDPRKGKFTSVDLNGREIAKYQGLLRRYYDVTNWQTVAVSTPTTRRAVGRVAIRAVQLYAEWLSRRQQVTPPESLRAKVEAWRQVGSLNPAGDAGRVALSMGAAVGTQTQIVNPDDNVVPPRAVAALGAPSMQAVKCLNPRDVEPRVVAAIGNESDGHTMFGPLVHGAILTRNEVGKAVTPHDGDVPREKP